MSEQVFADGIGPIVVVGNTVRLDFITFVPDDSEGGARPKPVVQHRLFMPIEAFVMASRRFSEAAEAIAKLEQQNKGTPAPAAPPAPVTSPAAAVAAASAPEPRPEPAPESAPEAAPTGASERPKPPFP